jgi:hypothetical protein
VVNSPHKGKSSRIKLNKGNYNQLKPSTFFAHNPTRNPNLNLSFCVGRRPAQTCSELFRPIQSCSDLIFYLRSGNLNAGLQTGSSGSETLTVGRTILGEPNLNAAPPMVTNGHLRTVILTKCPRFSALPLDVQYWMSSACPDPIGVRCSGPPVSPLRALRGSVVNHNSLTLTPCSQTKAIVANCRRSKIRPKTHTLNLNNRPVRSPSRPRRRPRFSIRAIRVIRGQTRQEFLPKIRGATGRIALHPAATQCNPLPSFFPSALNSQKPGV